jgi:hypothetical protein
MILDTPILANPMWIACLCEQNYDLDIAMEAMAHWEMIHEDLPFKNGIFHNYVE